ncbi:hypothetical protein DL770_006101 [Monosporascus sp. CRB-9-2]|nr:hypothetical protein DL770_006101 [Monosporascus sp. CRB-9-2]
MKYRIQNTEVRLVKIPAVSQHLLILLLDLLLCHLLAAVLRLCETGELDPTFPMYAAARRRRNDRHGARRDWTSTSVDTREMRPPFAAVPHSVGTVSIAKNTWTRILRWLSGQ